VTIVSDGSILLACAAPVFNASGKLAIRGAIRSIRLMPSAPASSARILEAVLNNLSKGRIRVSFHDLHGTDGIIRR
jgi:hypothetical protein